MKKTLLPVFALLASINMMADDTKTITLPDGTQQTVVPVATMKVTVDGETERTFNFGSYTDGTYYGVDFGDGVIVTTELIGAKTSTVTATAAQGVAKGDGTITIYAPSAEDVWYLGTNIGTATSSRIESIDLSRLTKVQQMNISGAAVETIDLSACDSLHTFTAAKGALTTMDFSHNPEMTSINLTDNKLTSVNVASNANLDQLSVYNNELTTLDLTPNAALTGLYAYGNKLTSVKFAEGSTFKTINLNDNELKSIELPAISGSSSMLYLNNNKLTELTVPTSVATFEAANNLIAKISLVDCTKSCKIENNCLTLETLPVKPAGLNTASKIKKFTYAPQAPAEVLTPLITKSSVLDLTNMLTAQGELAEGTATTTFAFFTTDGTAIDPSQYEEVEPGKFKFSSDNIGNVYATMTSDAFPKATGDLAFRTADIHMAKPVAAMKVTVDGETERQFSFGSYTEDGTYYGVDFGDGNVVTTEKVGYTTSTATVAAAKGVAKGDGTIYIYADDPNDIWYFSTSTGMSTTSPIVDINVTKMTKVQQMSIGGAAVATINVNPCSSLTSFMAAKGALTSMNFSNNPDLTSVNLTDNKLTSLNVAKCTKLDQLSIYNNELTELDLTTNPAITGLYAYGNKLTSVKFAEGATLKTINLNDNELESIELPAISGSSSMLYLNNNKLTELTVPTSVATFEAANNKIAKISLVDCTKSCKIENNCLTIATLPVKPAGLNTASKIKKFTYAPQAPLAVPESVNGSLDLSAQLLAKGELTENATTNFSFVDAEGNALTEGTDYTMNNGVATFKGTFTNIHAVMTTDAFPKATGANAFTTTAFNVAGALKGDINGDGTVNVADAVKLLGDLIAGETVAPALGDVNGSGSVDIEDAKAIIDIFLGNK